MIKGAKAKPRAHGLRLLRTDREFSQPELGEKVGVSVRSVQRYESLEVQPKPWVIAKLCEALNCEPWQLFHKNPLPRRSKRKMK